MCDELYEGLAPCPFCGSKELYVNTETDEELVYVGCLDCDAFGPSAVKMTKSGYAVHGPKDAWNKRAERTCTVLSSWRWDETGMLCTELSCGHEYDGEMDDVNYCPQCGARVVE